MHSTVDIDWGEVAANERRWQYFHDGSVDYMLEAIRSKVPSGPDPGPTPDHDREFYDQEQQARIVDEWFARHYDPSIAGNDDSNDHGLSLQAAVTDIAFVKHINPRIRAGLAFVPKPPNT